MALENFKNIDEVINRGTSLTTELSAIDLALIDQGFKATPFNIGVNDVLEFILYDSSNNILEQRDYGNIRYIKGEEINEYLIRSENYLDKVLDGGGFLIDIKRLIKEAGFNIGVFRVQLNFVNDRVGSSVPKDKMWIHEISPSRSELRLLPFDNFDETSNIDIDTKIDLNQAYNSFVLNKFSGDEVYSEIEAILNVLTPSDLYNTFKKIKSQNYIDQLASEFGINSFEIFFSKVLDDMRVSVRNALLHRNSTIGSNEFGNPLGDIVDFQYYNKKDIVKLLNSKFEESVDYHLPKRTLSDNVKLDSLTQESIDQLQQLVQNIKSDKTFDNPNLQKFVVNPPKTEDIKEAFTTQKKLIPSPIQGDSPVVIEVPILKNPITQPATEIFENVDITEKDRLRRLQEEMMNMTRTDLGGDSIYSTPTQLEPTIIRKSNPTDKLAGTLGTNLTNDDYIKEFERNNIKNLL